MSSATVLEELIEAISQVSGIVSRTQGLLVALTGVLDTEKQALSLHNLQVLEDISREKKKLVDGIGDNFAIFDKIARDFAQRFCPDSNYFFTLRGWVEGIKKIIVNSGESSLPHQIALHQISKLSDLVEELLSFRKQIDPKIRQNRYLIEKSLRNYQLSFRFWLSIEDQVAMTYGPSGQLQEQRPKSFMSVKA